MLLMILLWMLLVKMMYLVDIVKLLMSIKNCPCLSCAKSSTNMLFAAQFTQTSKIVQFWLGQFYVRDLKKGNLIVSNGLLDLMDKLYKFSDMTRLEFETITLISHIDERNRIWHERIRHLNF
jgi:hypothetical protein